MSLYASVEELQDQGIPPAGLGDLSDDTLETALTWASGQADSYFRKRFKLPLVSWGEDVKSAIVSMAIWRLLTRKGFNPQVPGHAAIAQNYSDAIKWLKEVASGDVEPDVTDSTEPLDEAGPLAGSEVAQNFRFYTGQGENQ